MPPQPPSFSALSNDELLAEVPRLATNERQSTAALVAALAALDERKLHIREGYSSLFAYCTGRLHLSEPAACRRIEAARSSRAYPVILERLAEGTLTLAAVGLLAKHLTPENHLAVIDAARHRSKRQLEELLARLAPQPDIPAAIRRLPSQRIERAEASETAERVESRSAANGALSPSPGTEPGAGSRPFLLDAGEAAMAPAAAGATSCPQEAAVTGAIPAAPALAVRMPPPKRAILRPLSPARYQITVTVPADTHTKLLRARDLLRHAVPSGDPALIIDRALDVLLAQLEKTKFGAVTSRTGNAMGAEREADQEPTGRRPTDRSRTRSLGGSSLHAPGCAAHAPREDAVDVCGTSPPPSGVTARGNSACVPRSLLGDGDSARRPSRRSRYIAAAVRREVWARSQGRCEFVSASGHRCEARTLLEFHHRIPFAAGGVSSSPNTMVLCKSHNAHEADAFFGAAHVAARRAAAQRAGAG